MPSCLLHTLFLHLIVLAPSIILHPFDCIVKELATGLQVHVRVSIPARPSKDEIALVEKLKEVHADAAKRPSFGKWF